MSNQNDLYDRFFDASPKKEDKDNLFLFNLQLNPINPADKEKKHKKKKDDDVHQYIKLAEQSNDKTQKSVKKWKEEQTMTPQEIRINKEFTKINTKFEKSKNATKTSDPTKKQVYQPRLINPFEKKTDKKDEKPRSVTNSTSTAAFPKKEAQKPKPKEEDKKQEKVLKVETKQQKIVLKENEKVKDRERQVRQEKRQEKGIQKRQEKRQQRKQQAKPKKHAKKQSSSQSSSEQEPDWKEQLRKITNYNPSDIKFKKRDRQNIEQSGVDRIFGEDKVSLRMGILEQQQDLRRQMYLKEKRHKHKHHH